MGMFAVNYTYSTSTEAERATIRPQHKDFLAGLHDAGRLRVSGPLDAGVGALLILEGDSAEEVASVLDDDPFRQQGLIADRTVSAWTIVFGGLQ